MKCKRIWFGILFYVVVGWFHTYPHCLQDNGSGNTTGTSPMQRYTTVFCAFCSPVKGKVDGRYIHKSSLSALWGAQISHQSLLQPGGKASQVMVMDNFYTRPLLARQLDALSDSGCKVLGTVSFNNMDGSNRPSLKMAVESQKML